MKKGEHRSPRGSGWRHTEETKIKISKAHIGKIQVITQETREKQKKVWADPYYRDYMKYIHTGLIQSPESIEKRRKKAIGRRTSEETIQKLKETKRRQWSNPAWAREQFRKLSIRPNDEELYVDAILQLNFPNQWKYVGDGEVWINRKCPDFINCNGRKIVIEYNGFKPTHTEEYDKKRTEHYARYGFETINLYRKHMLENSIVKEVEESMKQIDQKLSQKRLFP